MNFLWTVCLVLQFVNSFIPENRYSGWENLSLHSWEPLERGRHKHSLPSGWPLQRFCLWNPRLSVTWSARQFPLASVTGPEECFDKPHNALISCAWPLPDCGKVSSAQNVSISRDGVRVFCTAGKMAADEYNDSDRFSDDDVYDNLGENDFDLFELTEEKRAELANAFKDDSESGDELDDENLPLFFLLSHVLRGQVGDTAVTRDIPLMSSADVYRDIVNIVVQSYSGNIVCIYDRNGAWVTLKWNNHTVNSYFLLLCKPSPFHHHFKDTDNVTNIISGDNFYGDVIWDIRL